MARCQTHSAKLAKHRCDGCGKLLCDDCFEVGHRLLICKHCGERALPLEGAGPSTSKELARDRLRNTAYSHREALRYPLRGQGIYIGVGAIAYLAVLRGMIWIAPITGLGMIPLALMFLMLGLVFATLAAGLSFAIVRSTAEGGTEVPDWPDFTDFGERVRELLAAMVLGFMSALPAILLIRWSECGMGLLAADPKCLLLLGVGLLLGLPLWIPAFGAVGLFGEPLLSIRWDLHLRALKITWSDTMRIAVALVGLHLAAGLVSGILSILPLVGWLGALSIDVYAWFAGLHFIGLLMRKHEDELEPLYMG